MGRLGQLLRSTVTPAGQGWEVAPFSNRRLYPLPTSALLGITGERHHVREVRETLKRAARTAPLGLDEYANGVAAAERGKIAWFAAELVAERDNPYDANAVAVLSTVGKIGYLDRDHAADYKATFELLAETGYDGAVVPAFGHVTEQQVVLCLSFADICLRHLHGALVCRPAWDALRSGDDLERVSERSGFAGTGRCAAP